MAMPPATPMPWMVKLISYKERGPRYEVRVKVASPLGPRTSCLAPALFPFPESVADQPEQGHHRLGFIRTVGLDHDGRAFGGGEHHHAHDALGIDPAAVARDPYVGGEFAGELRELGRRARVQPQLVGDLNFPLLHFSPARREFACRLRCPRRSLSRPRA